MSLARGTKSQTASESLVAYANLGIAHKNKADIVTRGILAQSISMCLRLLFYGGGGGLMGCSPKLSCYLRSTTCVAVAIGKPLQFF